MKPEPLQSTPKAWLITNQAGFSMVEAILASAIFGLLVTALMGALLYGQESTALAGNRARATMLAEEGLEAARNIRDPAFANLTDGTFGLTTTGNQWNLAGSQDVSGIFTRQIVVSTVDPKRKSVTANVTWQQNPQRTGLVSLTTRLTNWIATGIGNWATPIQEAAMDLTGNTDGVKVQVVGNYAYVVRSVAASGFVVIDVSSPASPVLVGSLTLTGVPQNIFVLGNFAYVGTNDNAQELQIIDISTPAAPSIVGTLNLPGNSDVLGVYVVGTTAYLTRAASADNEFVIVNVATPAAPTVIGSLDLVDNGNEVVVSGNFAYIAAADNAQELKVINISFPDAPTLAGFLNLAGNTDATTIALAGSNLFIAQTTTLSVVSVTTPAAPVLLGSLVLAGNVNDIALNTGNANNYIYMATSDTANEFKVINVTTPATPIVLGQLNITGNNPALGVAYDETLDRAFVVGQSNAEELIVAAPQ